MVGPPWTARVQYDRLVWPIVGMVWAVIIPACVQLVAFNQSWQNSVLGTFSSLPPSSSVVTSRLYQTTLPSSPTGSPGSAWVAGLTSLAHWTLFWAALAYATILAAASEHEATTRAGLHTRTLWAAGSFLAFLLGVLATAFLILILSDGPDSISASLSVAAQIGSGRWLGHLPLASDASIGVFVTGLILSTLPLALLVLTTTQVRVAAVRRSLLDSFDNGKFLLSRLGVADPGDVKALIDTSRLDRHTGLILSLPAVLIGHYLFWPALSAGFLWQIDATDSFADGAYVAAGVVHGAGYGRWLGSWNTTAAQPQESILVYDQVTASLDETRTSLFLTLFLLIATLLSLASCGLGARWIHVTRNARIVKHHLVQADWRAVAVRMLDLPPLLDSSPLAVSQSRMNAEDVFASLPRIISAENVSFATRVSALRLPAYAIGAWLALSVFLVGVLSTLLRLAFDCSLSFPAQAVLGGPEDLACLSWRSAILLAWAVISGTGTGSSQIIVPLPSGARIVIAVFSILSSLLWLFTFWAISELSIAPFRSMWLLEHELYGAILAAENAPSSDSHPSSPSSDLDSDGPASAGDPHVVHPSLHVTQASTGAVDDSPMFSRPHGRTPSGTYEYYYSSEITDDGSTSTSDNVNARPLIDVGVVDSISWLGTSSHGNNRSASSNTTAATAPAAPPTPLVRRRGT